MGTADHTTEMACLRYWSSRRRGRLFNQLCVAIPTLIFIPLLILKTYRTAWDLQPIVCPKNLPEAVYPDDFQEQVYSMETYPWLSAPHLPRLMTRAQHEDYMRLMGELDALWQPAGIRYVIQGATLLGSYMMHDILPWDDDIDIWVHLDDLPKIKRLFANTTLRKHYQVTSFWSYHDEYSLENLQTFPKDAPDNAYYSYRYGAQKWPNIIPPMTNYFNGEFHMFKFFRPNATRVGHWPLRGIVNRKWNWPFIDIFFYTENSTHVWNYEEPNKLNVILKSDFYPVHKRPLGRLWLPAPHDPHTLAVKRSGNFQCYLSEHSHQDDAIHLKSPVCCSSLRPYYPMVEPALTAEAQPLKEVLTLAGKVIRTVEIKGERPSPHSKRPFDI